MRILLLPALLLTTALSAQTLTEQYIELTVSDTLPTRLKSIAYEITPVDEAANDIVYDDNTDYERVQREATERAAKLREKLEKDLRAAGYTPAEAVPYTGDPYTITSYDEAAAGGVAPLRVNVKDEAELKKLVSLLRARKGKLDAHVAEWNLDDRSDAAAEITGSLFRQARARAEQLAALGGRKLGKLLLVQDPQQKEMSFQDFVRMIEERDRGLGDQERLLRARMRSLTFRFALTD